MKTYEFFNETDEITLRNVRADYPSAAADTFAQRYARAKYGRGAWLSGPFSQGQDADGSYYRFSGTPAYSSGNVAGKDLWFSVSEA